MANAHTPQMPDVPIITRVYEERFMRESMSSGEKDCLMGEACECMTAARVAVLR